MLIADNHCPECGVTGRDEEQRKADKARIAELERENERLENLRAFDTGANELPKGLMLEYGRLDALWRRLVRERADLDRWRREAVPLMSHADDCPGNAGCACAYERLIADAGGERG